MTAGIISALVVAYCTCFGPLTFVMVLADRHGWLPDWIDEPLMVLFHPHVWVMYHQEWYFEYITWFLDQAGTHGPWNWQEFRQSRDDHVGIGKWFHDRLLAGQ